MDNKIKYMSFVHIKFIVDIKLQITPIMESVNNFKHDNFSNKPLGKYAN